MAHLAWNKRREKLFLEELKKSANVSHAARMVGLKSRSSAFAHKERSAEFSTAWDDAMEEAIDALELEARRRAYEGVKEPVFYQGRKCGNIQRYSDTLLIFLIKGKRPEYATERRELTGKGGGPIEQNQTVAVLSYDPNDPESIARAHEALFGAPTPLGDVRGSTQAGDSEMCE